MQLVAEKVNNGTKEDNDGAKDYNILTCLLVHLPVLKTAKLFLLA
jgi:hypothetical protein